MSVIWIIGQGEYSDFSVRAAFTSEEEADRIAAEINKNIEYDKVFVFPLALDVKPEVWTEYRAGIYTDGTVDDWTRLCVDWHRPDFEERKPEEGILYFDKIADGLDVLVRKHAVVTAQTKQHFDELIAEALEKMKS